MGVKYRKASGNTLLGVGLSLQLMLTMVVVSVCIQLFLTVPLQYPVGLLIGLASPILFVLTRQLTIKDYVIALLITFLCCAVSGILYDFSYDGQTYHQLAQIMLVHDGWNPFWSGESIGQYYPNDLWVNAYPKGLWMFAAALYAVTGNILMGKSYQFILMLSSFLLVNEFVRKGFFTSKLLSALCSFAIVMNPVVIAQSLSYYIDGALYLLIVDFLCLSYLAKIGGVNYVVHTRLHYLVPLFFHVTPSLQGWPIWSFSVRRD